MPTIEELKQTLDNLPSLEVKLQTWKPILVKLESKERDEICICLNTIQSDFSVEQYTERLNSINEFIDYHQKLFESLLNRLKIPAELYKQRINLLTKSDYKIKVKGFRISEDVRCSKKAKDLAENYLIDYFGKMSAWDYIRTCDSFVTGFLFTPNIFPAQDQEERNIRNEEFVGWNPEGYCKIFRDKIRELFKEKNLI